MNAALHRRLEKLEEHRQAETTIHIVRSYIPTAQVPESFATAKSYPQAVEKSDLPTMVIELEVDEDLNTVAQELGITADELHRQIKSGQVGIVYPPAPTPASFASQPIKVCWELP